jgi:hypothetical protein
MRALNRRGRLMGMGILLMMALGRSMLSSVVSVRDLRRPSSSSSSSSRLHVDL